MDVCQNCKAPINRDCPCPVQDSCKGQTHTYCHTCRVMYSVVYRSEYLVDLHRKWIASEAAKRDRMGLK